MPTNLDLHNITVEKDKVVADMRYPYLENRDYIQGVVVLDGMLQCAKALHPKATNDNTIIVEAKIMKPINYFTQCIALPTSSTENTFKSKDLLAKVELNIDGHSTTVVTLPKEDEPVTERESTDTYGKHIISLGDSTDTSVCEVERTKDIIDLIRAMEECHRDLIKQDIMHKPAAIKWAYLQNMPMLSNDFCSGVQHICLTEKRIIPAFNGFFDIREINFLEAPLPENIVMCFHAVPEQ